MKKLIKWFDENIIKILVGITIFFIPLFPKIPLHNINYTYVFFRIDDIFIIIFFLVFALQVVRRKIELNKQFLILFMLYWGAVFISALWGIYVHKNIIISHLGFLHAFRRIQYMFVFFAALSVVKSKKIFFKYLWLFVVSSTLVFAYSLGQKFLGWPAVQTMNPEYARGYLLFLTPEARISSTYAGHYDLAAFTIFFMPIIIGFYLFANKIRYFLLFILSILILVFTASRISYGAYIISSIPFLIFIRKPKLLIIAVLFTLLFTFTSKNLTSRFSRTFQVKQIFVNQNTGQVVVPQKMTPKELPAGSFYIDIDKKQASTTVPNVVVANPEQKELLKERILDEIRTDAKKKGRKLTYQEEQELLISMTAKLMPVNTLVSDISFATRLQVEWPRAIAAFIRNPILGTGPSSITEATDNDFLRSLGEVGLLGTILFATILFTIVKKIFFLARQVKTQEKYLYWSFIFGLLGLLFNAGYIDVFEASKIAYQFWLIAGLYVGMSLIELKGSKT